LRLVRDHADGLRGLGRLHIHPRAIVDKMLPARLAVVTVTIDAITYVIVDIGMRMLSRRELANAQGFPRDYTLDPIGPKGKPLSISSSIRMIGNSVCPDVAEALASANVPLEWFMRVAA